MEIVNPKIKRYLFSLIPERDEVLTEMEALARRRDFPIIGPVVGRLLAQLTMISGAKRILELGSGFGYSAYWFAKAAGRNGKVICTDRDPKNRKQALEFLKRAGLARRVDFRVGNALQVIDDLHGTFDIILNDIDKVDYPRAFRKAVSRLKKGGILITDNVIRHGRVVERNPDTSTKAILEYNRLIYKSPKLWTTIIPLRDGVSVSVKL
jgi:predicted O-methyltransferase YrrM